MNILMKFEVIEKSFDNFDRVLRLLIKLDQYYFPPLSLQVIDLEEYAKKIVLYADIMIASNNNNDIGLIAIYCNDLKSKISFITSIGIDKVYQNHGVASDLLELAIKSAEQKGFQVIKLEVNSKNNNAMKFYKKSGFRQASQNGNIILMVKYLNL